MLLDAMLRFWFRWEVKLRVEKRFPLPSFTNQGIPDSPRLLDSHQVMVKRNLKKRPKWRTAAHSHHDQPIFSEYEGPVGGVAGRDGGPSSSLSE